MSQYILIIDDEEDLRELLVMQLEEEGFSCLEASDIIEAQKVFEEKNIQLIISDVHMPHGSGLDFISELRKKGHHLPIVLLLTDPSPEEQKQAEALQIHTIFPKPFDLLKLSECVTSILNKSQN